MRSLHESGFGPALGGVVEELSLHHSDPGKVRGHIVIAAALAGHDMESAVHEGLGGTATAEMDHSSEFVLLQLAGGCILLSFQNCRDVTVQEHRRATPVGHNVSFPLLKSTSSSSSDDARA